MVTLRSSAGIRGVHEQELINKAVKEQMNQPRTTVTFDDERGYLIASTFMTHVKVGR